MSLFRSLPATPAAEELERRGVERLLVLDFDGVVNPDYHHRTFKKEYYNPTKRERFPNPHFDPLAVYMRGAQKPPKAYPLAWSKALVADLSELANEEGTQLVWLTTWREHMGGVEDFMGFKLLRESFYLPWGATEDEMDHEEKPAAFASFMAGASEKLRVAWVDDQVFKLEGWDRSLLTPLKSPRLELLPNRYFGLSRSEVDELREFLK